MGTTADKLQGILDSKADIKDAIEAKGVTVGDAKLSEYAGKIAEISGGGQEEALENDVNFYDYDGFRVASFTITEAKALTQAEYNAILPPTHDGLTFQEWNWTLADIQSYDRQYIDVGANYIPTDGKTHIKLKVNVGDMLKFKLQLFPTTNITVDYGDGASDDYVNSSGGITAQEIAHTYTNSGDYDLTIDVSSGSVSFRDNSDYAYCLNTIKEINCGNGFGFSLNYGLAYLSCLVSVHNNATFTLIRGLICSTIPQINFPRLSGMNITGYYPFQTFNGRISFPKNVLSLNSAYAFQYGTQNRIVVPQPTDTSTTIASNALNDLKWVEVISFPDIQFSTLSNGKFFNNNIKMREFDIVQGWTPTQNMVFSNSNCWSAETMVKLFTKLGTTANAITLTFGSTNLNKLTEEQKAIATNKGYTLA